MLEQLQGKWTHRLLNGYILHLMDICYVGWPYFYRFINLIEREWLQGGHPFSLRHGHTSTVPDKQRGPIFLLFLDSLWQVYLLIY